MTKLTKMCLCRCVCEYMGVYVCVKVWRSMLWCKKYSPVEPIATLKTFYSVNHDVYLFPVWISCYELNKNKAVGKSVGFNVHSTGFSLTCSLITDNEALIERTLI